MPTSFGALCTDFYVNQKLALKMDLPSDRETVLHLFDAVRKADPAMSRFRRYQGELALESTRRTSEYRWLALRRNSIRTGHVNPATMDQSYQLHRKVLELAPYHLTISPLDVDYMDLLFGFDLECRANHDEVVYDALFANTPMAEMFKIPDAKITELQPLFGLSLNEGGDLQAYFEVRTRSRTRQGRTPRRFRREPISIFLTVRKLGPVQQAGDIVRIFDLLAGRAEVLATERLVPDLLTPIARQITSSNA